MGGSEENTDETRGNEARKRKRPSKNWLNQRLKVETSIVSSPGRSYEKVSDADRLMELKCFCSCFAEYGTFFIRKGCNHKNMNPCQIINILHLFQICYGEYS